MVKKNTPPWYGLSGGPMIVACQWNRSSPTGPALHCAGGSLPRSCSSLLILFNAICTAGVEWPPRCGSGVKTDENSLFCSKFGNPLPARARCFYFTLSIGKSPSASASSPTFFFPYWLLRYSRTHAPGIFTKGDLEQQWKRTEENWNEKTNVSVYGGIRFSSAWLPACAIFLQEQKTTNFGTIPRLFR